MFVPSPIQLHLYPQVPACAALHLCPPAPTTGSWPARVIVFPDRPGLAVERGDGGSELRCHWDEATEAGSEAMV